MIPFDGPPTKEEFQSRLNDKNVFKRRHAERMIARYERDGKLISEYPYTIQILKIGDLTLVALAGDDADSQALLEKFPAYDGVAPTVAGRLYLIDPLGNLVLSYSAAAPDKALLTDVKKLLRLSHIG